VAYFETVEPKEERGGKKIQGQITKAESKEGSDKKETKVFVKRAGNDRRKVSQREGNKQEAREKRYDGNVHSCREEYTGEKNGVVKQATSNRTQKGSGDHERP